MSPIGLAMQWYAFKKREAGGLSKEERLFLYNLASCISFDKTGMVVDIESFGTDKSHANNPSDTRYPR